MRLTFEALIALIACIAMMRVGAANTTMLAIPFGKGFAFNLGWAFLLLGPFVIVAAGNPVNMTDGLDGLAIVPSTLAAGPFRLLPYLAGNAPFPSHLCNPFRPGADAPPPLRPGL